MIEVCDSNNGARFSRVPYALVENRKEGDAGNDSFPDRPSQNPLDRNRPWSASVGWVSEASPIVCVGSDGWRFAYPSYANGLLSAGKGDVYHRAACRRSWRAA